MHSVLVQSHPAAHVQPAEYEEQRKRISLGLFPSALLKAQEQVMGKEHAWELRYYQREFLSFRFPAYLSDCLQFQSISIMYGLFLLWIQEHRSAASRVKKLHS